jgi:hypothetical protein
MSAAGIKHRATRLVGLRLVHGRELVPGAARAAGADESGNTMPRLGCCRMSGRRLLPGLGFPGAARPWARKPVSGPGVSGEAPRSLLRQLFMLEELVA